MGGGRKRLPNNSWLDGPNGQTLEQSELFLDRRWLGRSVRPGVGGGGRNRGGGRLVIAFEESGETTHFGRGTWVSSTHKPGDGMG